MPSQPLELHLDRIQSLAEDRAIENQEFKKFLENSREDVDLHVRQVLAAVAPRIDCRACGNCCRALQPGVETVDIDRLAEGLGISGTEFRSRFVVPGEDGQDALRGTPCVFLRGCECGVYPHRPRVCAAYPYLDESGFVARFDRAMENYGICPIVFNVIERLKRRLWQTAADAGSVPA